MDEHKGYNKVRLVRYHQAARATKKFHKSVVGWFVKTTKLKIQSLEKKVSSQTALLASFVFRPAKKKPTPEIFSDSPKSTYIIYRYVYLNWSHQPTTSLSTSIVVIQPSPHHRLHLWIHELWPSTWDTLSTLCLCHWWGLLVSAAGTSPGEGKGRGTRNERA